MTIIEDIALVQEVEDGRVMVVLPQSESCDSCAVKGFCHPGDNLKKQWIETDLPLKPGDRVKIFISPALRITSSFIIFLMPIALMLLFYLISRFLLAASENLSILVSVLSLGFSGLVIWLLDKKWGKKIRFEITEKVNGDLE